MFFKKFKKRKRFSLSAEALRGVVMILLFTSAIIFVLAFFDRAGIFGIIINFYFTIFFGMAKWSIPVIFGLTAIAQAIETEKKFDGLNVIGLFLFLLSAFCLMSFWKGEPGGGHIGASITPFVMHYVGSTSAVAIFGAGIIISLLLSLDTGLNRLLGTESFIYKIISMLLSIAVSPFQKRDGEKFVGREGDDVSYEKEERESKKTVIKEYEVEPADQDSEDTAYEKPEKKEYQKNDLSIETDSKPSVWKKNNVDIKFPLSLLCNTLKRPTSGNIGRNQEIIRQTLSDFGIPSTMGEVCIGPTVTQYTFKPGIGIPVARVKAMSDNLALNLALHPVRIEAPVPGKPYVGLEVPNVTKVPVTLKEILQSKVFQGSRSNTMLALGRDVTGQIWVDDLVKMPHLLIAGATGSGKSVCLHSLITGLLYQNNPDDLKLILIDVKQVELSAYKDLPYLVAPVITDDKRAVRALSWCVSEMERRLETLSEAGCQNIQDYNLKKRFNRLPYLVVVVDELGDLLTTARKEAEGAIIRLGQKARAAGIHLILATQRPTADILSGLIKANMPGRIAFQVTSSINSKTILDFIGAEKLLGQGDMLFINPRLPKPVRIQGAWVTKEEVSAIVRYAKQKAGKAEYVDEILNHVQLVADMDDEVGDEMFEEAKRLIRETNKASATMLQSRLAIGYPRANRILDVLEKQGVVGPSVQNKPREVHRNNI